MIMLDTMIQATFGIIGGDVSFTPVPFASYFNSTWQSTVLVAAGLYDDTTDKITLSHESIDNGAIYSVINEDRIFAITFSVQKIKHVPVPNLSLDDNLVEVSSIVRIKRGIDDWENIDLSTVPEASFSGGTLTFAGADYTTNEFIFIKNGSSLGDDIFTTSDFIAFGNPSPGVRNPLTVAGNGLFLDVFSVYFISGQYVAYGIPDDFPTENRTATSTDLVNWTLGGADLGFSSNHINQAFFNGRHIIYRFEQTTGITDRILEIWSSSDGETWTQATLPSQEADVGVQGYAFIITSASIEVLTSTYTYRSVNGTTWTRSLLLNNIRPKESLINILGKAKGNIGHPDAGPDHIEMSNVYSLQLGGKIIHMTEINAIPILGYPSTAPFGAVVGWLQDDFTRDMIVDDGFTLNNISPASGTVRSQSIYARNAASNKYYEIEVLISSGTANKIGARGLGDTHFVDAGMAITDAVEFSLNNNIIAVSNGNDIAVTHTHAAGQIISFLFDFTAQTCDIEVDGVPLATVPNITNLLPWVIDTSVTNGRFKLNVGQAPFSHNTTGTTAWLFQSDYAVDRVPEPIWLNGKWKSSVRGNELDYGLPLTVLNNAVVSTKSEDNGVDYLITNIDGSGTVNVTLRPRPTRSGLAIGLFFQAAVILYKDADAPWDTSGVSDLGIGGFGGGTLHNISFADTVDEFIVINGSSGSAKDIYTTSDFIDFVSPPGPVSNSITSDNEVFTIYYIGGQYVAYGFYVIAGVTQVPNEIRTATSADLITWVHQTVNLPRHDTALRTPFLDMAYFSGRYYVNVYTGVAETARELEIWSSSDGITWTQDTTPSIVGIEGLRWLITTTAIELDTPSHVFRSTDGTTWSATLKLNQLYATAGAKGNMQSITSAPDHIEMSDGYDANVDSGRIIQLTEMNAVPTLGYPGSAPAGAIIGFARDSFEHNMVNPWRIGSHLLSDGFDIRSTFATTGFYARNSGNYYFEYTLIDAGSSPLNDIGARILGEDHYSGANEISVHLREDTIVKSLGNVAVAFTPTDDQVIGFLFDFTAQTLIIAVDGVTLHTATSIENGRSWIVDCDQVDGTVHLNVGQEAFIHNGTSATAWMTQ